MYTFCYLLSFELLGCYLFFKIKFKFKIECKELVNLSSPRLVAIMLCEMPDTCFVEPPNSTYISLCSGPMRTEVNICQCPGCPTGPLASLPILNPDLVQSP